MNSGKKKSKLQIGDYLRKLRKKRKWTAQQLADAIKVDRTYISKLENNNKPPSFEVLGDIAIELNDNYLLSLYFEQFANKQETKKYVAYLQKGFPYFKMHQVNMKCKTLEEEIKKLPDNHDLVSEIKKNLLNDYHELYNIVRSIQNSSIKMEKD